MGRSLYRSDVGLAARALLKTPMWFLGLQLAQVHAPKLGYNIHGGGTVRSYSTSPKEHCTSYCMCMCM